VVGLQSEIRERAQQGDHPRAVLTHRGLGRWSLSLHAEETTASSGVERRFAVPVTLTVR
jgi:hypothetical protein